MSDLGFDVELMLETQQRITVQLMDDMDSLANSHGPKFAMNVLINVGIEALSIAVASTPEEGRKVALLGMLVGIKRNAEVTVAETEAEAAIEKAKA